MNEANLHQQVVNYLKIQYPRVFFRTDFAAGIKMTLGQAKKHKALQAGRAWPDIFIAYPNGESHGLFLELKREGERIWLKDGSLTTNPHIQEQNAVLEHLTDLGYEAYFAIGFDQAKIALDRYLS